MPSIWGRDAKSWLETAEQAASSGNIDAIFAPDHLRTRDRAAPHTLSWAVLLAAARERCGKHIVVGPLVARCGSGQDEHVLHMLETLADSGPLVVNLGIGDRVGRREHLTAGLPWPPRDARIEQIENTARRCLSHGWEVYVASDRDDLHAHMPSGTGAHISPSRSRHDHGAGTGRPVAVSFWEDTNDEAFRDLAAGEYQWVCVEQLPGEDSQGFLERLSRAARETAS